MDKLNDGVDPYKVLGVPRDFTLQELKTAFKKVAVKVHPDKGGNEYMFNMVTECFKMLMREWKRKNSDKPFQDLKASYKAHADREEAYRGEDTSAGLGFSLDKFNRLFEENKRPSVTDAGYGTFLTETNNKEAPKFKGGTKEDFNSHFERHTKEAADKTITKYREPEPMAPSIKIQYYEMGVQQIDDFSGENSTLKRLNYSDLKVAHTTSRIIDPEKVKYKTYKSIDELKKDRGSISYELSKKDRERLLKQQEREEQLDLERQRIVNKQDEEDEKHYQKMKNLLRFMHDGVSK
jgi:curved DNA-binding protein CbpA